MKEEETDYAKLPGAIIGTIGDMFKGKEKEKTTKEKIDELTWIMNKIKERLQEKRYIGAKAIIDLYEKMNENERR